MAEVSFPNANVNISTDGPPLDSSHHRIFCRTFKLISKNNTCTKNFSCHQSVDVFSM